MQNTAGPMRISVLRSKVWLHLRKQLQTFPVLQIQRIAVWHDYCRSNVDHFNKYVCCWFVRRYPFSHVGRAYPFPMPWPVFSYVLPTAYDRDGWRQVGDGSAGDLDCRKLNAGYYWSIAYYQQTHLFQYVSFNPFLSNAHDITTGRTNAQLRIQRANGPKIWRQILLCTTMQESLPKWRGWMRLHQLLKVCFIRDENNLLMRR